MIRSHWKKAARRSTKRRMAVEYRIKAENVSIRKKIKAVDLCTWVNWTEWMVRFEMLSLSLSFSSAIDEGKMAERDRVRESEQ